VALASGAAWFSYATEYFWRNPLVDAQFRPLTDFPGNEFAATISRDGKFVAFLSDRDGEPDGWVTQIGTGQFHNLTVKALGELVNASVRSIGFSPDATLVTMWTRQSAAATPGTIAVWAVPTLGGTARPYLEGAAEFDWSSDSSRLVYHTAAAGDPMFVREDGRVDRQIFVAPSGLHAHYPLWSRDGGFVYFVQGSVPDAMDIWRLDPAGTTPERITYHNSRVSHPVFLDARTLLYLATSADGSGPWIYGMDVRRRVAHRLNVGTDRYTSLAASADGRRVAATVVSPKGRLWRVPITTGTTGGVEASEIKLPTVRGASPRYGPGLLVYVSSRDGGEGVWKVAGTSATELWRADSARIVGAPAIAPDGTRIAFTALEGERARLYVMNADGSALRQLSESFEPRGAPAWSPDGESIAVAAMIDAAPRVVRVGTTGGAVVPLAAEYSTDPEWSPDGTFVVFSGPDVGTTFPVRAVDAGGRPYHLPEMTLSRGARRLRFLPGRRVLVFLRGELERKDFWQIDLETGIEHQLTRFARPFNIRDFDVSPDGREIVFDEAQENSDLVLIERPVR
jgi:Tol biopolymer transport system component